MMLYHIKTLYEDNINEKGFSNSEAFKRVYKKALEISIPNEAEEFGQSNLTFVNAWSIGIDTTEDDLLKLYRDTQCYFGDQLKSLIIEAWVLPDKANYIVNSIKKELK